jgi:uncharacterized protein (DUF169 family)
MHSQIAAALNLKYHPVALLWAEEAPAEARQFQEGKRGCIMYLVAHAAKGGVAAFDRDRIGCDGGAVGLGFGNHYLHFPGGIECFYYFLSTGNNQWEHGRAAAEEMKEVASEQFFQNFTEGGGFKKDPELVRQLVKSLPFMEIPAAYTVAKPLEQVDPEKETPVAVTFLANPNQLSALVILANYERPGAHNVVFPSVAACQSIGIYAYREANADNPRAVVGLNDLAARRYLRKIIDQDCLSFSVPWKMLLEMEANVPGSFLEREVWRSLAGINL